ncbi:hypothetical protein [Trinickia acidisoli]|uniref:hypothetical protein n=1 Tax=Trinickia acidisoli TaxID=2767482 RepID=UPI001A8EDD3D|nr:hypothetical protein [Trinickia acidisoli]
MTDTTQNGAQPATSATVQQAAEHMRIDFATTGAFRPQDVQLVLGDIRSSVVVAAVDPLASFQHKD